VSWGIKGHEFCEQGGREFGGEALAGFTDKVKKAEGLSVGKEAR